MPEVLVLVLAVIVGAIWLLVIIGRGIMAIIDELTKSYNAAAARRKERRYSRGRDSRRQHVRALIPDELDGFEKKLDHAHINLERAQQLTQWLPHPPAWQKEEFRTLHPPLKDANYSEMCVDEIDAILTPNSNAATWSHEETQIIGRHCKYPFAPPASNPDKFAVFPALSVELKQAVFEVDAPHVSKKDVERYFADEQINALKYNNRRADLITRAIGLNSTIENWNRTNRISWDAYVSKFEQMGNAALLEYQKAAELYIKACREEVGYFKRFREAYKKAEKQYVIERLGFVLDRIRLPGSVPHTWDIDFDEEQQIAVIDIGLPDVVHRPPYKTAILKSGLVKKPLNQTEKRELVPKVHPAILLRTAHEVFSE